MDLSAEEFAFLDEFFDESIGGKRANGGSPRWLWVLARKVLGDGWVPDCLDEHDRVRFEPDPVWSVCLWCGFLTSGCCTYCGRIR